MLKHIAASSAAALATLLVAEVGRRWWRREMAFPELVTVEVR